MSINNFVANAIKTFRALSLPMKIVVSVVGVAIILNVVSRFNYYRYQKNIEKNTTPHKQAVDVTRVPSEVKTFLSDENLQKMDEGGMNIYTGDNPPNIEGTYVVKDQVIKYDPEGANFPILTYYYTFKDQTNKTVNFSHRSEKDIKGEVAIATGRGVFISGEGNCFSVYLDNDENIGDCESKSAHIFSACTEEKGLVDIDEGTLWTYRGDKCTEEEHVPAGYVRIFSHKSLAPRQ